MNKKIAFIFPGQGAQAVGMGKDFYENFEVSKQVFDTANKILGKDIAKMCFEGPEDALKQTENTQPAIVATSIAALVAFRSQLNITPAFTAGHSLGEYCAMYCSKVMDLETTMKAIQKRAQLMSAVKGGAMAAILNLDPLKLEKAIEEASKIGYVDVANYNSPVQVVITGDEKAVQKAGELAMEFGAKRVVPLAVSGAFHSKFLEGAGAEFSDFVKELELTNASVPVVTNVDASETISCDDFRSKMPRQIYSSVHWTQTIENMVENGVETFVEIGPGKVLAGLNRKINSNIKTYNIYDCESLNTVVEELKNEFVVSV